MKNFCLLKVLDLQDAPVNQISEAVGSLFHLQYLSLRGTKVKKLPSSIGKLQNLQTLDLKHSLVEELPTEISKLRKLRHLVSYSYHWDDTFSFHIRNVTAGKIPAEICQNSLGMQNLGWVDSSNSLGLLDQLGHLKQLRRLGVAGVEIKDGSTLCNAIKNMHRLQTILIASRNKDEVLDLDHMSSPPMFLRRVLLIGRLQKFPSWISQLENVVKIGFCHSRLKDGSFEPLGKLPNLKMLVVSEAYDGETLYFGAMRFQKLKILRLFYLYNLKVITMEPESLPVLEELELGSSPHMEFPTGIQHLKSLTLLNLHDMPKTFSDDLTPNIGQHFGIINHVPNVYVNSKAGAGRWESSSLRCPYERETLLYTQYSGPLRSS
ncbi:disease resistance protein RPM1-like [Spinacia oleracea]|uniref:Disease resistance protein RPM1-like n=1 Tax=Spinacia oleracea TaxID=3562 RepID=A0A9R0IY61_SPIOL|nr:disease resistance protein RPM1-like [Spinacia oleracea]